MKLDEYIYFFHGIDAFLYNKVHIWRIGLAKFHGGLYNLKSTNLRPTKKNGFRVAIVTSNHMKNALILRHAR